MAINLLDGRGFSMSNAEPFLPNVLRTPAYPLFIAGIYRLLGRNPSNVVAVQGLVDVTTCLVLWVLIHRLTKSQASASIASFIYAINPTAWYFANTLLTETLLAHVITWLGLIFIQMTDETKSQQIKIKSSISIGLLCGLAALIKPNALLTPMLVILCLAKCKPAWRLWLTQAGMVVALWSLPLCLWSVRNWGLVGRPIFSSAFTDNINHISAVATLVHARHKTTYPFSPLWEKTFGEMIVETAWRYNWSPTPPSSASAEYERLEQVNIIAREIIQKHPVDFALSHLEGFLHSWMPEEYVRWHKILSGQDRTYSDTLTTQVWDLVRQGEFGQALAAARQGHTFGQMLLAFALWLGWVSVYIFGGVLLVKGSWRLKNSAFTLLVWGCLLYLTFLPGPISDLRFRFPMVPLLNGVMAVGIITLTQKPQCSDLRPVTSTSP